MYCNVQGEAGSQKLPHKIIQLIARNILIGLKARGADTAPCDHDIILVQEQTVEQVHDVALYRIGEVVAVQDGDVFRLAFHIVACGELALVGEVRHRVGPIVPEAVAQNDRPRPLLFPGILYKHLVDEHSP